MTPRRAKAAHWSVDLGPADRFEHGVPVIVKAAGRELAVVRWREEIYAVRNVCPHQTQSFVCGQVYPMVRPSDSGELVVLDDEPVLVCPWHTWGFKLGDGACLADASLRVRTYSVRVLDGSVVVSSTPTSTPCNELTA